MTTNPEQPKSETRALVELLVGEIESMQGQLDKIRKDCVHTWERKEAGPLDRSESFLPGVFIGEIKGPIHPDLRIPKLGFTIVCASCLKEMAVSQSNTCLVCFAQLVNGMMYFREKVFGEPYIYYGARVKHCPNSLSHWAVACDEWDQ